MSGAEISEHLARAEFLMAHDRFAMADLELRGHLALNTDDAFAHALLARCLSHEKRSGEAIKEARAAVSCAPDMGFAHCILAEILSENGQFKQAESEALEALRLEPENASYFSILGNIRLNLGNPRGALESADAGLTVDSESIPCARVRSLALTRLGRSEEAREAAHDAIRIDPMDARSHASRGWSLLEMGLRAEALVEFQEALRIEPQMEWARNGMLTALKARYPIYRWVLSWSFFLRRFGRGTRYAIVFGLWFGSRAISFVGAQYPSLQPLATVMVGLYALFCYLTWTSGPLFNSLLRFNKFGRLLLTRSQIIASTCYSVFLIVGVAAIVAFLLTNSDGLLVLGVGSLVMTWFVGVAAQASTPAFQRFMIALGVVLTVSIVAGSAYMVLQK